MSRRHDGVARCEACRMHVPLCVCALVPSLRPRAQLRLLVHVREARKPTNTGQLAVRALAGAEAIEIGAPGRPITAPPWPADHQPILLFPDDDAVPIATFATHPGPLALIVPDGNWRQAGRMRGRVPGLAEVPCVRLADRYPTNYRLRTETKDGGLATLEAIAFALAELEGEAGAEIARQLLDVFTIMVERTLWLRGAMPRDKVTGGVPQAAVDAQHARARGEA